MISRIYTVLMAMYSTMIVVNGFWMGFRPVAGFANFWLLIWYGLPIVLALSSIYFIWASVLVSRGRLEVRTSWPKRSLGIVLMALLLWLPASWLGTRCTYAYAGFDSLRTEADGLMNDAGPQRADLAKEKYPPSFKRFGAFRVYVSKSRVDIVNNGWVGRKSGIAVFSKDATVETDQSLKYLSDRVYTFNWN